MSFLSILQRFGSIALTAEHVASPIVSTLVPASAPALALLDNIVARVQSSVVEQEARSPIPGSGASKLQAVISDFNLSLLDNMIAPVLAARGETVTYDHAALETGISAFVSALNSLAAVKQSVRIVPSIIAPATSKPPSAPSAASL